MHAVLNVLHGTMCFSSMDQLEVGEPWLQALEVEAL
jgi:hypothetical protein